MMSNIVSKIQQTPRKKTKPDTTIEFNKYIHIYIPVLMYANKNDWK